MCLIIAKENGIHIEDTMILYYIHYSFVLVCRTVATMNSGAATPASTGSKKEKKATTAARFTIYKVNKASRKKREKSSAKKERKATKTLAIVLGKCSRLGTD